MSNLSESHNEANPESEFGPEIHVFVRKGLVEDVRGVPWDTTVVVFNYDCGDLGDVDPEGNACFKSIYGANGMEAE